DNLVRSRRLDGLGPPIGSLTGVTGSPSLSKIPCFVTKLCEGAQMLPGPPAVLRTDGDRFVDPDGRPIRLRGVCIGGWLNMENFITGYAANETLMRAKVRAVLGDELADRF